MTKGIFGIIRGKQEGLPLLVEIYIKGVKISRSNGCGKDIDKYRAKELRQYLKI
jgi:hypothetical protein